MSYAYNVTTALKVKFTASQPYKVGTDQHFPTGGSQTAATVYSNLCYSKSCCYTTHTHELP